jgi:LacI family transcriptional regulator
LFGVDQGLGQLPDGLDVSVQIEVDMSQEQNSDRRAPTLSDIAKSTGVSLYTVSVVLNGARSNTRVSAATRERILEVAAQMRYHPNAMARGLMNRRMQSIGILFCAVNFPYVILDHYAATILQGALVAATAADYSVTIFTDSWRDASKGVLRLRDGRTDGFVVVAPPADTNLASELVSLGLPLTVIAYPGAKYGLTSIDVDNEKGIHLAVDHLLQLGHTRIAHLTGNQDMASVPLRRDAFCAALRSAGLTPQPETILPTQYNGGLVPEAVQRLLQLPEPPTAIVAGNDNIAIAALAALRDLNVAVPDQISVVGFDDTPPAALVTPALTTVQQPLLQVGETAARLLIAQIEQEEGKDQAQNNQHLLEPKLVVRASTTRPRTANRID